jgi:predicted ester cyclase
MSTEENKELVRRYFKAAAAKDSAKFEVILAGDYVGYFPGYPEPVRGIPAFIQVISAYWTAFPDVHSTVEELIAEGQKVVARCTVSGTQTGPLGGPSGTIPPTGKQVTLTADHIYRIEDDEIAEERCEFDELSLLEQLGVLTPAPHMRQLAVLG